jgi:hypothetical protein
LGAFGEGEKRSRRSLTLRTRPVEPGLLPLKLSAEYFGLYINILCGPRGASIIAYVITKCAQFNNAAEVATRRSVNSSDPGALEDTNRMPEKFLRLESFTLEAAV